MSYQNLSKQGKLSNKATDDISKGAGITQQEALSLENKLLRYHSMQIALNKYVAIEYVYNDVIKDCKTPSDWLLTNKEYLFAELATYATNMYDLTKDDND